MFDRFIVRTKRYFWCLQVIMLFFFIALLLVSRFSSVATKFNQTPWNNFQLFTEFVVWGIWYPLTLLSVLFAGRIWCGAFCPLGAVSQWLNHIGLKKETPRWMKHGVVPISSFIVITILAQTLDVRDDVKTLIFLFLCMFALAALTGFFLGNGKSKGKRVWCRHVCPIGSLLGVFSRLSVVHFTHKNKTFPVPAKEHYQQTGLCPTMINLKTKSTARHCISCGGCVVPGAKRSMTIGMRSPDAEVRNIRQHSPSLSETWFIFIATGLAAGGFLWISWPYYVDMRQSLGVYMINHSWLYFLHPGPAWLMDQSNALNQHYLWLDFFSISAFMMVCAFFSSCSLFISSWLCARVINYSRGNQHKNIHWQEIGYQFAPLAMMSIMISLGGELFQVLSLIHFSASEITWLKAILFLISLLLSFLFLHSFMRKNKISPLNVWLAHIIFLSGCSCILIMWLPAANLFFL